MSRDILSEATRALRDEAMLADAVARARDEARARETREQIVTTLRGQKSRGRRGLFVVPLAAILVGSSAWASGLLPEAWQALTGTPVPSIPREAVAQRPTAAHSTAVHPTAVHPTAVHPGAATMPMADLDSHAAKHDEEPSIADDAAALPSPSSLPSPSHSSLQSPALPQGDSRATPHGTPLEPALDPNAALYRAAHDAHFAANNPALALQRWNAYLTAAPGGRFAPEAAFNRALCLVRLGQHQAAVAALQPFASGNYGTYRQAEATRLVEALSSQPAQ